MILVSTWVNRLFDLDIRHQVYKKYSVSTGRFETPTPIGLFRISERWLYPRYKTHSGQVYEGSARHWTGIGPLLFVLCDLHGHKMHHSIHGFVDNWKFFPDYVKSKSLNFTNESSGCIRMRNKDILELDRHVKIGEKVVII